ncbi:MAG: valine--tRNA ligase, partial [Candidatus Coatesbacteria bacterium]|nr:valine--tRNA ligase [Candidatus Coatesbacteria bacterium]
YIINWCPRCQTALSDLEAVHLPVDGNLYYIKYPIKDTVDHIVVATTRPETMLGDTAVAIHPSHKRAEFLKNKTIVLPVIGREMPVILDDQVDPEFGTGIVKITPAHDPNDFEMGNRHGLPRITVLNKDGTMNQNAGEYAGMDRFECRRKLIQFLKENGLLEKIVPHKHMVGHCQRCETMVEPYLSQQWFVKMKPLAEPAIEAVKNGDVEFISASWANLYYEWMENIRDWCISRQLWWGHRIPAYYCQSCDSTMVAATKPESCDNCGSKDIVQDEDVLDTWFSSALWPFSTLGWPEETDDLKRYYPTSCLITAFDIIFFWVARMIVMGLYCMKEVPFKVVYFNGLICDEKGQKMSKSKDNVVDARQLIADFGTDAVRFALAIQSVPGRQSLPISESRVAGYRNFVNKIWNASRFILMNLSDESSGSERSSKVGGGAGLTTFADLAELGKESLLLLADKWIISRLVHVVRDVTESLEQYKFYEACDTLYQFIWHEYCDWFIELAKLDLYQEDDPARKERCHKLLCGTLDIILRVLHPIMPYITEEVWQHLPKGENSPLSIAAADSPEPDPSLIDDRVEREMNVLMEIIIKARTMRSEMNVPPAVQAPLVIYSKKDELRQLIRAHTDYVMSLTKTNNLTVTDDEPERRHCATAVAADCEIFVPLEGIIDFDIEQDRLKREIAKVAKNIKTDELKIRNREFMDRAPSDVIELVTKRHKASMEQKAKLERALKFVSD